MKEKLMHVSDRDIVRSAKLLVDQHGGKAPVHAATEAEMRIVRGADEEFQTWFRIMQATIEMLRTERLADEAIN